MSLRNLQAAFDLIATHPKRSFFAGPREPAIVDAAERAIGTAFPRTYREFVLRYGAGNFGSAEFYGVIDQDFEASGVPDGIWYTLNQRRSFGLATNLIVIGNTGDGGLYCLDVSGGEEAPVVLAYPNATGREIVATDFGSFLLEQVQAQLGSRCGLKM